MDSKVSLRFPYDSRRPGVDTTGHDQTMSAPIADQVPIIAMDSAQENELFEASSRLETDSVSERGGFEPPKPVSQFNGLANRLLFDATPWPVCG